MLLPIVVCITTLLLLYLHCNHSSPFCHLKYPDRTVIIVVISAALLGRALLKATFLISVRFAKK